MNTTAIIIGAGPAGLTAAYELIKKTDIKPIIIDDNPIIIEVFKFNMKGKMIDNLEVLLWQRLY